MTHDLQLVDFHPKFPPLGCGRSQLVVDALIKEVRMVEADDVL
jgi:hypothetical protein